MVSREEYENAWNDFNEKGILMIPQPGRYIINDKQVIEVLDVLGRSRSKGYDAILLVTRKEGVKDIEFFWIDVLDWWYNAKKINNK